MAPIQVIIPSNSILDPSEDAAVVGGNVLTSQRVVDTILEAFQTCAASQGCMNNITIGDMTFGYYETVAGGSGAVSSHTQFIFELYQNLYFDLDFDRDQLGMVPAVFIHI